jgi:DNA-binding MarR family transcriptional regulator
MKARDMDEMLGTNARLAIVLTLADGQPWVFTDLREETGLADGNLHVQTGKLVLAKYLDTRKVQRGNRLVTAFSLTPHGWAQLKAHAQCLGQALRGRGFPMENGKTAGGDSLSRKMRMDNDDFQVW